MKGELEAVVYIARKLHWSKKEIGKLTLEQFRALIEELSYQEAVEDYQIQHNVASILAAIKNTVHTKSKKVYKAKDFLLGEKPERIGSQKPDTIQEIAQKRGIQLPSQELKPIKGGFNDK